MTYKRWIPISSILVLLLVACAPAEAYFRDGNELVEFMRDYEKRESDSDDYSRYGLGQYTGFVIGVADLGDSVFFDMPTGTTAGQIYAVVAKYLKDHPEQWAKPAHELVVNALAEAFPMKQ